MSETVRKLQKCWIAGIAALLLLNINTTHAKKLVFEKGNGEVVVVITEEGSIEANVDIEDNNNTYITKDLIFYNPEEAPTDPELVFSPNGVKIKRNMVQVFDGDFPETALKFNNENVTEEEQAAVTIEGDLLLREMYNDITNRREPNYIRFYTYQEPGAQKEIVTTQYSDGLGKDMQTQLKVDNSYSLVSGIYFDKAGRQEKVTKSAPLFTSNRYYPMYYVLNEKLFEDINAYYEDLYELPEGDGYAYSKNAFYEDPLNRINKIGSPGKIFSLDDNHYPETWYFGIPKDIPSGANLNIYLDENRFIKYPYLYEDALNYDIPQALKQEGFIIEPEYFLTVTKDPNGNYAQQMSDIFGNVIRTWAHTGEEQITGEAVYDILGQIKEETPSGHTNLKSEYGYNLLGQMISKDIPDAMEETYEYDNAGRIITYKKAIGTDDEVIINYQYDQLGRIDATKANGKYRNRNYYDNTVKLVTALTGMEDYQTDILDEINDCDNLRGRLIGQIYVGFDNTGDEDIDSSVIDLYTFDDEGRPLAKYRYIPQLGWHASFIDEYNVEGKILRLSTYPKYPFHTGFPPIIKEYEYDKLGRLSTITRTLLGNTRKLASYYYDDLGRLASKSFYNEDGSATVKSVNYDYNIREWGTKIDAENVYTESIDYTGEEIPGYVGNYNGNISKTTHTFNGIDEYNLTYRYDYVNRLTGVTTDDDTEKYREAFAYDVIGRITNKEKNTDVITSGTNDYDYYDNTNQLKRVISNPDHVEFNYTYDNRGNMKKDESKNMKNVVWDWRDMPVSFEFKNDANDWVSQVDMIYDASGNRVVKREFGINKARAVLYADGGLVFENENIESSDPDENKWVLKYANFDEGRIDYESQTAYYYILDHLGSTRSVISDKGEIVEATMYDSYGKMYSITTPSIYPTREKFTGKEFDEDGAVEGVTEGMELFYFGARYYNAEIGLWISKDPAMEFWNLYGYAGGNPISFIDPEGSYIEGITNTDSPSENAIRIWALFSTLFEDKAWEFFHDEIPHTIEELRDQVALKNAVGLALMYLTSFELESILNDLVYNEENPDLLILKNAEKYTESWSNLGIIALSGHSENYIGKFSGFICTAPFRLKAYFSESKVNIGIIHPYFPSHLKFDFLPPIIRNITGGEPIPVNIQNAYRFLNFQRSRGLYQ